LAQQAAQQQQMARQQQQQTAQQQQQQQMLGYTTDSNVYASRQLAPQVRQTPPLF